MYIQYDFSFCFKYSLIKSVNCLLTSDFLVLFISDSLSLLKKHECDVLKLNYNKKVLL